MFHYLHDNMPMTLVKQCGLEPLHLGLFSKVYDKQFEATEKKQQHSNTVDFIFVNWATHVQRKLGEGKWSKSVIY